MLKQLVNLTTFFAAFFAIGPLHGQGMHDGPAPVKVTIFIPISIDSAYANGQLRPGNSLAAYITNGLDFFNGIKIAAADLQAEGTAVRIKVIDSRKEQFMEEFFRDTLNGMPGLVISAAQNAGEFKTIAESLRPLQIPLISTLPNDAGIAGYPQLMLANSTLKTHCQQMHLFLQRNHSIDNLLLLDIPGNAEQKLLQYLEEANKTTPAVKLKWKEKAFADTLSAAGLSLHLDSNRTNVIIAPTLNPNQASRIVKMLSSLAPSYRIAVFGMPTWETQPFTKTEFKGVDVWYGTPFITSHGNPYLNDEFSRKYRELTNSKPGDMAYRGYELTLRYVRTLSQYEKSFMTHINDFELRLFNEFHFKPVTVTDSDRTDYQENQRVYFVKKTDGIIKSVLTP